MQVIGKVRSGREGIDARSPALEAGVFTLGLRGYHVHQVWVLTHIRECSEPGLGPPKLPRTPEYGQVDLKQRHT